VFLRSTPYDDLGLPGSSYRVDGDRVRVVCVATGQLVRDGRTGDESPYWYKLDSGMWMSLIYLNLEDPSVSDCDP
jgi:hypothetical protein